MRHRKSYDCSWKWSTTIAFCSSAFLFRHLTSWNLYWQVSVGCESSLYSYTVILSMLLYLQCESSGRSTNNSIKNIRPYMVNIGKRMRRTKQWSVDTRRTVDLEILDNLQSVQFWEEINTVHEKFHWDFINNYVSSFRWFCWPLNLRVDTTGEAKRANKLKRILF